MLNQPKGKFRLMLSVGSDLAHTGAQSGFDICRPTGLCVVVLHTDDDAERRWVGSEVGRGFAVKARA